MTGNFSEIISSSFEWTITLLFKPFKVKKWILLCFIALLSAEMSSCNSNVNLPSRQDSQKEAVTQSEEQSAIPPSKAQEVIKNIKTSHWFFAAIAAAVVLFIILVLFLLWLYSRFAFVFINSIVKNDASIKAPFKENMMIGNSYFKWNLLTTSAIFLIICLFILLIAAIIYFLPIILKIIMIILWAALLFLFIVCLIIINVMVREIVLPIMFMDKINIISAWRKSVPIIKLEKTAFAKYLLLKLALRIAAAMISGLFTMGILFALVIQLAIIGGALFSVSLALPAFLKTGYYIFIIALGVLAVFLVFFLINLALLPVPVFFRTFSLKFLSRLDERYNLFRLAL